MSYLITNQNNFGHIGYPCPSYPKATVKSGGCGACAVLNCVENTSSLRFDMGSWIDYVIKNRGRIDGGTDIAAILQGLKRDYGFDYECTNDLTKIKNHLKQGGMGVFHVGGAYGSWKGLLSSEGHYVCVGGMSGDNALVIDSGWYAGKYKGIWRKNRIIKDYQNGVVRVSFANLEKDKKYRNNQGNNYYLVYAPKIDKETEDKEMIYYNSLREIPEYGKKTIEKLLDKGVLQGCGNGNLQISEDMLRILVINHRAGLYD